MNRTITLSAAAAAACIVLSIAVFSFGQAATSGPPGAAAAPGTPGNPAPAPTTRRVAVVPQGFKKIEVNGRAAMVEPADEQWLTATLQKIAAATRPASVPATVLEQLTSKREPIIRQLMTDLVL
jgi:hypothetical protein